MYIEEVSDHQLLQVLTEPGRLLLVLWIGDWDDEESAAARRELAGLAVAYSKRIGFCAIRATENPTLEERFAITRTPTGLMFQGGEEIESFVGFHERDDVERLLLHALVGEAS